MTSLKLLCVQGCLEWLRHTIIVMGKPVLEPRSVVYMADNERLGYTYSHRYLRPDAWDDAVMRIKVWTCGATYLDLLPRIAKGVFWYIVVQPLDDL